MGNTGTSLVLRDTEEGWDETRGDFIRYTYEGTESAVRGERQDAIDDGAFEVRIISAAGVGAWRLVASYNRDPAEPSAEAPTVEFRMDPGRVKRDIVAPPYQDLVGNISDHNLAAVRRAIANNSAEVDLDGGPTETAAQDLYVILLRGEEYKTVYYPTFTLLRTASSLYTWPSQETNVGTLFLANSVITEIKGLTGNIEPNFQLKQETFSNSATGPQWNYGWLKHAPHYDTTVGNKTTESIDYEYGLWPQEAYSTPS